METTETELKWRGTGDVVDGSSKVSRERMMMVIGIEFGSSRETCYYYGRIS